MPDNTPGNVLNTGPYTCSFKGELSCCSELELAGPQLDEVWVVGQLMVEREPELCAPIICMSVNRE